MSTTRDILLRIREERGILTAPIVVEVARDPGHPLHDRFEWDDSIAGERYREGQARDLLRSQRIQYTSPTGAPKDLRGFVSVSRPDVPSREYIPVEEVAQDPVARTLVLREAERAWRELRARYQDYEEFFDLVRGDLAA